MMFSYPCLAYTKICNVKKLLKVFISVTFLIFFRSATENYNVFSCRKLKYNVWRPFKKDLVKYFQTYFITQLHIKTIDSKIISYNYLKLFINNYSSHHWETTNLMEKDTSGYLSVKIYYRVFHFIDNCSDICKA